MDALTAALIIGTIGASIYTAREQQAAQEEMRLRGEIARESQVYKEQGIAKQLSNLAMSSAANRQKTPTTPSFSGSFLAGLPSLNNNNKNTTSGTF